MVFSLLSFLFLPNFSFAQNRDSIFPAKTSQPVNGSMQTKTPFGISDETQFEKFMPLVAGIGVTSKELLSEQSLKSYMMPPRKSGINGGTSSSYALASALEFYINMNNNYKDNLSPDYIRVGSNKTSIEDGLSFLCNNGTISAAIMPYDVSTIPSAVYAAQKYRIRNYLKLFQPSTRGLQKVYELRKAIMRGNPVIVEMQITNGFKNLQSARYWKPEEGDKTSAGSQYLIAVGYDEERKAIEFLNCWGREWGNGGYIWVSYDDFGEKGVNGFVLIP